MVILPRFHFNKIYKPVFTTTKRTIDVWGGRGRGGSYFATDYALFLLTRPEYCRIYFVRQIFGDIRESLFREFKDRIADNPTLDIKDFIINDHEMKIMYKPTGNIVIAKGVKADGSRTAKMKSLAGGTHIIIEEADEIGEEDFLQMNLSLRTIKGKIQILRIFNPPGTYHHIWEDYVLQDAKVKDPITGEAVKGYFTAIPKETSNVLSIFSTFRDNIKHLDATTLEEMLRLKKKKPEYYWTVIEGLISEGAKGRIFSGWQKITDKEFNDVDAKSIFGLDFGIVSAAGLVECKFVKNRMYVRELNYEGLTVKQIAKLLYKLRITVKHNIVADCAEPDSISQLRRGWKKHELDPDMLNEAGEPKCAEYTNGWSIYSAHKGPGSIVSGIKDLRDMDIYATETSDNLWKEYREYKWALDKNKNPTDEPIDDFNHLIDPMRYVKKARATRY